MATSSAGTNLTQTCNVTENGRSVRVAYKSKVSCYLAFFCASVAKFIRGSASSFETGFDMAFKDFHTCSLSSGVFALRKGFKSISIRFIEQSHRHKARLSNKTVRFHLQKQNSSPGFSPFDFYRGVISTMKLMRNIPCERLLSFPHS